MGDICFPHGISRIDREYAQDTSLDDDASGSLGIVPQLFNVCNDRIYRVLTAELMHGVDRDSHRFFSLECSPDRPY